MWIVVHLTAATICLANHGCFPALVGVKTPVGHFVLRRMKTDQPGYSGDVLAFAQDATTVYAVHRVWLLSPKQHRLARLASPNAEDRTKVTNGCINVMPEVYDQIPDGSPVSIIP